MTDVDKNTALIRLAASTRSDVGRLSFAEQDSVQRVFSAIWELESQVNNGGFDAYLRYVDSESIAYAPLALREVGAFKCAAIVEKALGLLGAIPPTRAAREDALQALNEDEALEALDEEFFAYPDDLTCLLHVFVVEHAETFGPLQ